MRRVATGLLILISALAMVLSSTSLWTRRHVVNTDVFVAGAERIVTDPAVQARIESQVVASILSEPAVQQAIGQAVAVLPPQLRSFRPTIVEGARSLLSKGVRTILTSSAFSTLTSAALRSAQTQLLAGQPIRFTLGQAKALVPAQSRTGLAGQVLDLMPDDLGITVLTKQQAPQVYTLIDLLKSLWLWLGLLAFATLVGALVLSRRRSKTLRAWSVTTGTVGLLLVLALKVARGPLLGRVKPVNVDVADAIYQGVTATLRNWTLWLVLIMVGLIVITLLWGRIGLLPATARGYRAVRDHIALDRQQRPHDTGSKKAWPDRVSATTRAFVDGLNLPDRLGVPAAFLRRNLRAARWTGIAPGVIVLLFWPSPTLSTLIWVAALLALYLGLIELVLSIAATDPSPTPIDAGDVVPSAAAPAATEVLLVRQRVGPEDLAAMGGRLDLLMRLGEARTAGVLTEEEFAREKADLLAL
ncbi:MAG TPA: SHOCT domain-containing protein [Pseudonocardiaceae bacterium]|nr:SHOCT domain-containing protein [Pseudonocardiaceae bacterium]